MTTRTDLPAMWLQARDAAFALGDVARWRTLMLRRGAKLNTERVAEVAFHKARYEAMTISAALREESKQWLLSRGFMLRRGLKNGAGFRK